LSRKYKGCNDIVVYWLQIVIAGKPEIVSQFWASWHDWIGRERGILKWKIMTRFRKSWRDSTTSSPSLPERDWSQRLGQKRSWHDWSKSWRDFGPLWL